MNAFIQVDGNFYSPSYVKAIKHWHRLEEGKVVGHIYRLEFTDGKTVETSSRPTQYVSVPNHSAVRRVTVTDIGEDEIEFEIENRPVVAWRIDQMEEHGSEDHPCFNHPTETFEHNNSWSFLFDPVSGNAWSPWLEGYRDYDDAVVCAKEYVRKDREQKAKAARNKSVSKDGQRSQKQKRATQPKRAA